jgi:IS30 family transposase
MTHSQLDSTTKIKICASLLNNGISPEDIPAQLGVHRATVYRWKKKIKQKGINKFVRDYAVAKKGRRQPRKTDPLTKIYIFKIRQEYHNCCGEKIKYILQRDYGKNVSVATIYHILGERFILRSKWKKYSKRGFVRKGTKSREVIQTDTVDLGEIFAFTAVDTFTKEASVVIKPELTSQAGKEALVEQLKQFKHIDHIQRDGGHEFKLHWQEHATKHIPSIRTARPYKKNEQAFIERFNGILRKECLGHITYKKQDLNKVQQKVNEFLNYYHTKRPHLSLNMRTPHEFNPQCRI